MGKASKSGCVVTCSRPVPSTLISVEIEAAGVLLVRHVRSKNDALAVGEKIGREIRGAVMRNLSLVAAVGIHHPDFQIARTNQAAGEQVLVVGDRLGRFGLFRAVHDFLAVVGKPRAAVVAQLMRQLAYVASVGIHRVNVQVAVAHGREENLFPVPADGGFRVVPRRIRQASQIAAVGLRGVNRVRTVNGPDVALGIVGPRRACGAGFVRRGKQDALAGGEKVAAGRASLCPCSPSWESRACRPACRPACVHLIAGNAFALMHEDQILVIRRKISLGVGPAKRELANIAQMLL